MRTPTRQRPLAALGTVRGAAALLLLLAAGGCERKDEVKQVDPATLPIKVGMYMDLSGQTSSFGQSSVSGAQMAVDEINASGGVLGGKKLELVVEDTQGRPEQAATVVTKLINQDQVVAVIGEVASSNSLAAAPIAQRAGIPMITPASTNPDVTAVGDFIFRVCFVDPFQGEVLAKFAANTLKGKKAAIFLDTNSSYSRGLAQFFTDTFTKLGGKIVSEQSYTQTDRDFSGQLTAIRAANPDVLFIPGYYGQVGVIVAQAKQLGIDVPMFGGDGWDAPQIWDLGGEALNGTFMSNHYSVDDPTPVVRSFVEKYRNSHRGNAPDAMAVLAYDAVGILKQAIERAGSTEAPKLRDGIAATKDYPGITGSITINETRDAVKPAIVLELRDRHYVYKETVYPTGMEPPPPTAAPAGATTTDSAPAPAAPPAQ